MQQTSLSWLLRNRQLKNRDNFTKWDGVIILLLPHLKLPRQEMFYFYFAMLFAYLSMRSGRWQACIHYGNRIGMCPLGCRKSVSKERQDTRWCPGMSAHLRSTQSHHCRSRQNSPLCSGSSECKLPHSRYIRQYLETHSQSWWIKKMQLWKASVMQSSHRSKWYHCCLACTHQSSCSWTSRTSSGISAHMETSHRTRWCLRKISGRQVGKILHCMHSGILLQN